MINVLRGLTDGDHATARCNKVLATFQHCVFHGRWDTFNSTSHILPSDLVLGREGLLAEESQSFAGSGCLLGRLHICNTRHHRGRRKNYSLTREWNTSHDGKEQQKAVEVRRGHGGGCRGYSKQRGRSQTYSSSSSSTGRGLAINGLSSSIW